MYVGCYGVVVKDLFISTYKANINSLFFMTIFYIPHPAPYLNLTTTLLTINKQQIRSLLWQKS